uniref:CchlQ n=1 Tax=Streptomyces subtropicus TaxID=882404 RepID=E0X895_9ACTN|nr:CchlQ [Streptomyces subtropicus]
MFGCAFVGMLAGLLPRATGRREVLMLAVYGSLSGYLFGFLLNLSFWPFSLDPNSSIAYLPGLPFTEQWQRYLAFDVATSLGWDTGRAVTNFVCVMLAGPAVLTTFRRAARKARFRAPVRFAARKPDGEGPDLAARAAFDEAGVHEVRERFFIDASAQVAGAGQAMFQQLRAVQRVVGSGAAHTSAAFHDAYHPYLDLVWAYRVSVRGELKDRAFSPESFGWEAWDGRERCPVCRGELTTGA